MNTHTIRNKNKPTPIMSLTPAFMERVLKAQPEAIALTLEWFKRRYKELTGKGLSLDYDQTLVLQRYYGAREDGSWTSRFSELSGRDYRVVTVFEAGFLATSTGLVFEDALEVADRFYAAMAQACGITDFKAANNQGREAC